MSRHLTRYAARAATIIALASSAAFSTAFGPPHIAVRKVTASDNAPAGTVLVVEGKHHNETGELRLVGRAEGIVDGKRVSQPLRVATQATGRFTVSKQWQDGSPWVLVLTAELGPDGAHAVAEALVRVDVRGTIGSISYPVPGWIERSNTPRRTPTSAIDGMLAQMVVRR